MNSVLTTFARPGNQVNHGMDEDSGRSTDHGTTDDNEDRSGGDKTLARSGAGTVKSSSGLILDYRENPAALARAQLQYAFPRTTNGLTWISRPGGKSVQHFSLIPEIQSKCRHTIPAWGKHELVSEKTQSKIFFSI